MTKKISDNPTTKELKSIVALMRALGTTAGFLGKLGIKKDAMGAFKEKIDNALPLADILDLPDRFNDAFGEKGWITVGSAISVEVMKSALAVHDAGDNKAAEQVLVNWFTKENIELFAIIRARRFHHALLRDNQLREALSLYLEERYMAAVPLILIACDGFASDVAGISPFEKDADLSCFDSITGHSSSLPALIKLITKGTYKSKDATIDIPQRHGILHGRVLGYANETVCAKAWLLMMALVDWAIEKSSEDERWRDFNRKKNLTWADLLEQAKKSRGERDAIDSFEPHEVTGPLPSQIDQDGPENAVLTFLSGWQAKNYGRMAQYVVNLTGKPTKKMAGEIRLMAEPIELEEFKVLKFFYSTIVRCDVRVWMKANTARKQIEGEFDLFLIRYTEDGQVALANDKNCVWSVQQLCIYNVMNEKYAESG